LKPDDDERVEVPEFHVSYKPQKISPKFQNSVRMLLHKKIRESYMHPQFNTDVMKPLRVSPPRMFPFFASRSTFEVELSSDQTQPGTFLIKLRRCCLESFFLAFEGSILQCA
jgi:hypothetical protein